MEKRRGQEEIILEAKNFFDAYKKDIMETARSGERIVRTKFSDIEKFSTTLADNITENPEETIALLESALEESELVKNPRIRFLDVPTSSQIKIRNIRSKHLDQLLSVEGIVRQASDVRPQVVNARFECPSCGAILSVLQVDRKFRDPSRCSCNWKGNFKLLSKEMVDVQRVVIEESPDSLEGGEQPRRINVFLKEDLVDPKMEERTTPGSRVRFHGILKEVPVPLQTGISTRFDIALEANNTITLEESFEDLNITEEDIKEILELAADPHIFKRLSRSIAPSIYGFENIKEAVLLQLFSGVRKIKSDGGAARGDIHILLVGDPGVAKSVLLKFISSIAPKGRYVSGKAATAAGMTAAVVKDEFLRGWSLEAGAMVLSNKGLVAIDEIEKMNEHDRSTMHEAMEQQCYHPELEITFADGSKEKIGNFVNGLMEKNKEKIQQGLNCEILELEENKKILTTDLKSIYPIRINKISRHKAPKELIKIALRNGQEITVTPKHPCWIVKDGKITTIPAQKLKLLNRFPTVFNKRIRWSKIKSIEKLENKELKWVYDITVEPTHSFISNNMILHNSVTISKANIHATLRAETTVLAAGNPKLGRFDPYTPIPQQIDISPALLSRFDVIFIIRDLPNKSQDEAIASHVLEEHKQKVIREIIEPKLLRKYIAYAKQKIKPRLTDEAIEEIKNFYVKLRNQSITTESDIKPIPITARQLEGIIRLAEAHARVHLKEKVAAKDAKVAIDLLKASLSQVGYDEETKSFDIDKITTGITSSKRGKILIVKDTLSQLESRLGKLIPIEELKKAIGDKLSETELEETIEQLSKIGDIFKPKRGHIQKI